MKERIFDQEATNLNAISLIVPTEEGTDEDDRWNGSIGDATTKHVSGLSAGERQIWEGLIVTKSGHIFRSEPSHQIFDSDSMNLRGEDLDNFLSREITKRELAIGRKYTPTESELAVLREVEEEERARRQESEDAYERSDTIPYSQMEKFPGMEKHIEMPRTPKDNLWYMGDCNQMFYDEFPEGHPDARLINTALSILNRDSMELTEDFIGWFNLWLSRQPCRPSTMKNLSNLASKLLIDSVDPCEAAREALRAIDADWSTDYLDGVEERTQRDIFLQMLRKNQKLWAEEAKKGIATYRKIKAFGSVLFREYRDHLKYHHWALYRKIKASHCPRVMVRGVDINRCDMDQLRKVFKVEPGQRFDMARNIWTARPFENIADLHNQGYLTAKVFIDEDPALPVVEGLENFFEMSKKNNSSKPLEAYRGQLIRAQRDKLINGLTNWTPIWAYYRLLKSELDTILGKEEQVHEQGRGQEQETAVA